MALPKNDAACPFHRAEKVMDDLTDQWRAKAAKLSPQAAGALAQSLRSLRKVLDQRIHDIEKNERPEKENRSTSA